MNASGCGVTVKEYGHILKDDPVYASKARRISELTKDLSELLPMIADALQSSAPGLRARIEKSCAQAGLSSTLQSATRPEIEGWRGATWAWRTK
jgi:hypothetical protein